MPDDDWEDVVDRLRSSAVDKDEPVLALSAALVVAQTEAERLREALRYIAYGHGNHWAADIASRALNGERIV